MNKIHIGGKKLKESSNLRGNGRKLPLQNRSRERVQLIIDNAEKLLTTVALPEITTSSIAKSAGIPVGSIYQYFKDRDAILLALGGRVIAEQDQKLERIFEEVSAHAHWRHVVKVVVRAFVENIYEGDIHFRLDTALSNNTEWRAIHMASERRIVETLSNYPLFVEKGISGKKARIITKLIVLLVTATVTRTKYPCSLDEEELLVREAEAMITAYLSTLFGD